MSLISLCRCLQQHSESRGFYWPETWGVGQAVIYPWCSTTVWGKILLKRYRPLLTAASDQNPQCLSVERHVRFGIKVDSPFLKWRLGCLSFFPHLHLKSRWKQQGHISLSGGLLKRFSENSRGFPTEAGKTWNTFATIYSDFVCLRLELITNTTRGLKQSSSW